MPDMLYRACGSELEIIDLCEGCNEPVRRKCDNCLTEKESPHMHRALVQYVLSR